MSWLTAPDSFHKYPLRSAVFLAPTCGLVTGAVVYFEGSGMTAAVVTGVITAFVVPLYAYWRFGRRPYRSTPQRRRARPCARRGARIDPARAWSSRRVVCDNDRRRR